jgi:hypothetical protein
MLRKPLHQPKGSERDAWDALAHHQMVMDEEGNLVAVGRLDIYGSLASVTYSGRASSQSRRAG